MAKWADFLITGVWKNAENAITHVMLHADTESDFSAGAKRTEAAVISLIDQGYSVKTIRWDYTAAKWKEGARVRVITLTTGRKYLRSVADATSNDNLDNSFPAHLFA